MVYTGKKIREGRNPRALGTNPRAKGTNPIAQGTNPRALGTNPRALGTNPRALEQYWHLEALRLMANTWKRK